MTYDYAELSADINSWSERGYTQPQIDSFIRIAEANFNRRLGGYQREKAATITLTNGVGTLPADFIRFISVAYTALPDLLAGFRISGNSVTMGNPAYPSIDVVYAARLAGLTGANPTNWLLDLAPDAYLFMVQAAQWAFEEEFEASQGFAAQANGILDQLDLQSVTAKFGAASLQLRAAP